MSAIHDIDISYNDGSTGTLGDYKGKVVLVVNTASQCGFTPQYQGLQQLQETYSERGFTVLGVPCNQFGGQEPGSDGEVAEFCSLNYGVNFPLSTKVEVNGENTHPLYRELKQSSDAQGESGDVKWNFEKFLLSPEGEVLGRYRSATTPAELSEVIEAHLPR
ncbi:Hydroperoxy fatty acid reductase gpx1 [Corynebacterium occultum]|uniref:Glutathione peroxidase n=1 Tax=Corynebacterium occultum TaxID=2675219 RepID=A0A6B8VRP9_9CORY|nr:glutathione peroxidase [Corynebacterium occultum]QGU08242.1 Hydroperoxy fatty acid reductase gpx1 [Corynebacterium occultum]